MHFSQRKNACISLRQASRIWKGGLVCDLEDFDFLHCEKPRTREKRRTVNASVVRVRVAKVTPTAGVCKTKTRQTRIGLASTA
jgi:hypothetical protein